jgi:hypothetical protein
LEQSLGDALLTTTNLFLLSGSRLLQSSKDSMSFRQTLEAGGYQKTEQTGIMSRYSNHRAMTDHIPDANKMVETPRTDAAYSSSIRNGIFDLFKESQNLERELTAANARVRELEGWIRGLHQVYQDRPMAGQCAYIGPQKPEGLL